MGLSIAISGGITMMVILMVLATLFIMLNQVFVASISSSQINNLEDSISKTSIEISSLNACSGSDVVKFGLANKGIKKLSNFDKFNFLVTYDADTGGASPTRLTEEFTYNATAFRDSLGIAAATKEIPHAYAEMVSRQMTESPIFVDIPGANLSNTNFDQNKKYLIYVTAQFTISDASETASLRLVHGGTAFTGSENGMDPISNLSYYTYAWFTVWSPTTVAEANEDVKLQFRRTTTDGGTDLVRVEEITMFALEISEELTENTDWYFNEDTTANQPLGTTWTVANNAAVTFTPNCAGEDWLVMGTAQLDPCCSNGDFRYQTRIEATGGVTNNVELVSKEVEDNVNDLMIETLVNIYTIPEVATTFTSESQLEAVHAGEREYSAVFAMNLDKFKEYKFISSPEIRDVGAFPDFVTEVHSLSFDVEEKSNVWVLGYFIMDGGGTGGHHTRMQLYENGQIQVDQPPTQTTDLLQQNRHWDGAGEHEWTIQTVENLDAGTYTVDIDADSAFSNTNNDAEDRLLAAFSMITEECLGGDSGDNLLSNAWTINCINYDNFEPGIINTHEVAEVLFKLQNPIFAGGILEISISTDNGETASESIVVP